MTPDEIAALATRFFDAIEAGDVETARRCYAPDARIWHNTEEQAQDVSTNLKVLRGLIAVTTRRRYLDRRLTVHPGGFAQQHVLLAERLDGPCLRLPAALICAVADDRITRLDEYFDSRALDAWNPPA